MHRMSSTVTFAAVWLGLFMTAAGQTRTFSREPEILLGLETLRSSSIEFADVDGDGDLDAVASIRMSHNLIYLNDGTGTFADPIRFGPGDDDTIKLALA